MLYITEPKEPSSWDDIIELYKKDVDKSLILENLKLTPEQRLQKMQDFVNTMEILRNAYKHTKQKEEK